MEEPKSRPPSTNLNKSDLNDVELPKPTWFGKEFAHFYVLKHRPRILAMTTSHLYIFKVAPTETQLAHLHPTMAAHECKVIPLIFVDLAALTENGIKEPDVLHLQLPDKLYRFRSTEVSDAIKWRMAILSIIRIQSLHAAPNTNKSQAFTSGTNTSGSQNNVPFSSKNASADMELNPEMLKNLKSKDLLIFEFEKLIFTSVDKAKFVANLFFDSLAALPSKDRNNRAKEVSCNFLF
jgi:hypothetical protein